MGDSDDGQLPLDDALSSRALVDAGQPLSLRDESGTAPEDRPFRPDVEGLRAVAIFMVVLFHSGVTQARGGFFGVDVFFVISGFVITGLLLRERARTGTTSILSFYARRARRILPAAVLVIVVSLIATDALVGRTYADLVASDGRWTAVFLGNFHFTHLYPTFFVKRPASPLQHYWSLAVEEQFYLVYPAIFVTIMALPGMWSLRRRLGAALVVIASISLAISLLTSKVGNLVAYGSPFTHAWELALGALIAISTGSLEKVPHALAVLMAWTGLVLIVVATLTIPVSVALPGTSTMLPVGGAALVIAGGAAAPPRWGAEALLRLAPFRWVGRWSYSWYLWHWPILVIAAAHVHTSVLGSSVWKNLGLSASALVLAAMTYFCVENPIRHSRRLARNPGLTMIGAVLLIASCVAFTFVF